MNTSDDLLAPSPATSALTGCFKLAAGRAVTLAPREAGVLRIVHGRVWLTVDGRGQPRSDVFLSAGEQLTLRRGERLVMESFEPRAHTASAWFHWDPVAETMAVPSRRQAVTQPLADLRLALLLGAGAAGRLVLGVAGLVGWTLGGRGAPRDLPAPTAARALSALATARRTQGAISCGDSVALSGAV